MTMRSSIFIRLAAILAIVVVGVSGCNRAPATKGPGDPLVFGMELSYPPFEMVDGNNHPCGVGPEMAEAMGKYLGRPVEIVNIPFDGLILALKGGRVDLVISSMTATAERAQSIDFSDPYVKTGMGILVKATTPGNTAGELDVAGRKIAVKRGTTGHTYAMEHMKNATVLIFDKDATAVMEVAQGKADAFFYDQLSIYQNWQRNLSTTRAILSPVQREEWAIGIRKGNDELKTQVNAFLKDFREKGGFQRLGDKYLKDLKEAFAAQGIEFVF